ncbi:MAG: TlpA family protein disulfide reductase [Pseudomonadota bacterium]
MQGTEPAPGFWSLAFDTPDGTRLALADWRGQALILNFWATWCPPCVREMPMLAAAHAGLREHGIDLLGLAVDGAAPVREFLARQPVPYRIGLAGFDGMTLASRLGNERGGLPFTVAIHRSGHIALRKLGELGKRELLDWAGRLKI